MVGIAVAAMVPGDDTPAGFGEERCETVEGACEIGAAMDEEKRRGIERAHSQTAIRTPKELTQRWRSGRCAPREVEKDTLRNLERG